ncbi:MAG: VWA domain-containing protein [Deltaproteobacteria bacterium]|nr:VWA domain-containing protein [Deltaproteobacteria bacterium]
MEFFGLSLAQLLPLFGAAGASIVVLYILKLRRRQVPVPFARLWQRVLVERPTSALFQHLKRILSLLLQLIILALLVFALADPRFKGISRQGRNLVVLMDGSASMQGTDVPTGRAGVARESVRRMIREMGSADRMLLAQMDGEITALSPLTDDVAALESALREYAPRDTGLDFSRAMRFSLDALRGLERTEVIIVGDGGYGEARDSAGLVRIPEGTTLRHVAIGRTGRNVGISAFSARRYPLDKTRYEVLVELQNFGTRREEIELSLYADDAPLEVTRMALEPGRSQQRVLRDQSGANQTLEARIRLADQSRDDLPADDRAYATLPARHRSRVLIAGPANLYVQAALLLDEYIESEECTLAEAPARLRAGHFDLVILDGPTVALPEGTPALYLHPEGADSPLVADTTGPSQGLMARPTFDRIESRHPLMRFMSDLEDTNVGVATRYRLAEGDRAVASSAQGPLVVVGERRGGRFVAVTFDLRASDLPLRVSWPVLVINTVDWIHGEDPAYLSSFKTGESWRIPVAVGSRRVEIESPDGRRSSAPVIEGRAVFRGMRAGFYRVHSGDDVQLVAGNIADMSESQLAPRPFAQLNGTPATSPVAGRVGVRRELWLYLLGGAIAIALIEWLTYHRRVTV